MKKAETIFKERVFRDLEDIHATVPIYYTKIQQVSIRGTPDVFCCINGVFIAIELKRSGAIARTDEFLQEYNLAKIRKAGGIGVTLTPEEWPEFYSKLKKLTKGEKNVFDTN